MCIVFSRVCQESIIYPFVIFLRFSDVGDAVLLTAASRDGDLCRVALNEGRAVIALEPDQLMMKAASENLDAWTVHAAKSGMWARMLAGPIVTVGRGKLPTMVPPSNISVATAREIDDSRSNGHGYASDVEFPHELKVAAAAAEMHGLEIRVRSIVDGLRSPVCLRTANTFSHNVCLVALTLRLFKVRLPRLLGTFIFSQASRVHGQGLFAKNDFSTVDDFIPLPLEGSFEVHDSLDDCLDVAKKSEVPRFKVCDSMSHFLSQSEVSRPTSALYLVPDRTCPLFYMNSSAGDAESENFVAKTILKPSKDFKKGVVDVKEFLRNAKNCVCFSISVKVQKGNELFAFYEIREDGDSSDYEKEPLS